jgi:hypothetical protein
MVFLALLLCIIASPIFAWTNPKDALISPRGQKVCMQQCGTSALTCPEAFVSLTQSVVNKIVAYEMAVERADGCVL